jgi:iron complex transport system substrate-binding protein
MPEALPRKIIRARRSARCARATILAVLTVVTGALVPKVAAALQVQDDEQDSLELPGPAQRIVSLAPGATAMLFAAGAGAKVVGTTAYSVEPEAARKVERIGDALSFDLERILALHPDVVVVWGSGTSSTQIARLQNVGLRIYRHRLRRLDDIPLSLQRFGRLAGTEAVAQAAAAQYAQLIASLRAQYRQLVPATVLLQVWDRPIYTIGRPEIMTDVVNACGDRNLYDDLTDPSPAVTLESVLARNPQIILALAPDEKSGERWAGAWRAFPTLRAVQSGRVIPWSDQRLSRLGPSIVDAAADLCRALRAPVPHS